MSRKNVAFHRLMPMMLIAQSVVFAIPIAANARSCIVNAGTQTYEVYSSVSTESTVAAARTTSAKVSADVTETRRNTTGLSSAGSLSTMPLGSVLILR